MPFLPTRTCGSAAAFFPPGEPMKRSPRFERRFGSSRKTARRIRAWRAPTGLALGISRRRCCAWFGVGEIKSAMPLFEKAIELNPEAGYSYLQLSLLLAWEGQLDRAEEISRHAVDLQEQYISGNLGLQIVGAHARLGYVHYLREHYDDALREYEREMAFIGAGDHA